MKRTIRLVLALAILSLSCIASASASTSLLIPDGPAPQTKTLYNGGNVYNGVATGPDGVAPLDTAYWHFYSYRLPMPIVDFVLGNASDWYVGASSLNNSPWARVGIMQSDLGDLIPTFRVDGGDPAHDPLNCQDVVPPWPVDSCLGERAVNLEVNQSETNQAGVTVPLRKVGDTTGPPLPYGFELWPDSPPLSSLNNLTLQVSSRVLSATSGNRANNDPFYNFPTIVYGVIFENHSAPGGYHDGYQKLFYQLSPFDPRGVVFNLDWFGACGQGTTPTVYSGIVMDLLHVADSLYNSYYGKPQLVVGSPSYTTYSIDLLPRVTQAILNGKPGCDDYVDHDLSHWRATTLYLGAAMNAEATIESRHRSIDLRYGC